jgi:hypothetical protein
MRMNLIISWNKLKIFFEHSKDLHHEQKTFKDTEFLEFESDELER